MTKNSDSTSHIALLPRATLVLLLALLFVLPACYTILKHPMVIQEDYTQAETQNCGDCHLDSDLWNYHHPHVRYRSGSYRHDPWEYYYDIPWWYDSYWFYDDNHNPETVPLHERTLRPGADKEPISGGTGGNILPPPGFKTGTPNIKTKVKTKEDTKNDTGKTSTDKKRSVRPSKKKKKDN